jgi:ketosteroid isomerase-like protein
MRNLLDRRRFCLAALALSTGGCTGMPRPATVHDETADRVAIEALVVEYAYLLDHGRAAELAMLFTEDGIFETLGMRAVGRAAIAAYYVRREPRTTRHISTNLRLVFETPDRASGTRTILYYRGEGAGPPSPAKPGSVGEYSEVFQRGADGKWRFASRVNKLVFSGSGGGQ